MLNTRDLIFKKKTSKEVDRKICGAIWDRRSNIKECDEVETAGLYEDSSGDEC